MALETGTYISDLVATNPAAGDPKSQGDDHIRFFKSTIKATFPNINGAMTRTEEQLNGVNLPASFVPTCTVVSGASSISRYTFFYFQLGDYVFFVAEMGATGVSAGTPFVFDMEKPTGGSFVSASDISGGVINPLGANGVLAMAPDTVSLRVTCPYESVGSSRAIIFGSYLVR